MQQKLHGQVNAVLALLLNKVVTFRSVYVLFTFLEAALLYSWCRRHALLYVVPWSRL